MPSGLIGRGADFRRHLLTRPSAQSMSNRRGRVPDQERLLLLSQSRCIVRTPLPSALMFPCPPPSDSGVVGLACARALALAGRDVVIIEKETAHGTATSSRNSEGGSVRA